MRAALGHVLCWLNRHHWVLDVPMFPAQGVRSRCARCGVRSAGVIRQ